MVSSRALDADTHEVVLDRTLFYPESGGQVVRRGPVGWRARYRTSGRRRRIGAAHGSGPAPASGEIAGTIDWARRFDHMQQHTGQHVLSRAFIEAAQLRHRVFPQRATKPAPSTSKDPASTTRPRAARRPRQSRGGGKPAHFREPGAGGRAWPNSSCVARCPEGVTIARIVSVRDFDAIRAAARTFDRPASWA